MDTSSPPRAPATARRVWRRDRRLRERIAGRLAAFDVRPLADPALRRAAVALAIVDAGHGAELPGMPAHPLWRHDAALLLTRRASTLARHAGQWALPGGRVDDGETAEQAALRELHEELGLAVAPADVLGRLDDLPTRSGFVITPVVVWAGGARTLRPDPREVARAHRIPFAEWLRAEAPMLEKTRHGPHPVLRMPLGEQWVAAPTASAIYQFREVCLLGRATRVAHFDQPEFAWR